MKFITESDLRALYQAQPFDRYVPQPGTKITPGARQFLIDRKIRITDSTPNGRAQKKKEETPCPSPVKKDSISKRRLLCRLASVEAMFLATAQQLLEQDIQMAQQVIELSGELSQIKTVLGSGGTFSSVPCASCTGIGEENAASDLGDCFAVTGFHIQLQKGKEIILLHQLRCTLREMNLDFLERAEIEEPSDIPYQEASRWVNQILNRLSQMICEASGGKVCRRKT